MVPIILGALAFTVCFPISLAFLLLAFGCAMISEFLFHEDGTWWEQDIDGDGIFETIQLIEYEGGGSLKTIYDNNGIIYQTEYDINGEIIHQWKIIPSENENDQPTILVWDEKSKQWLPDQNKDGIPDPPNNLGNNNSPSSSEPLLSGGGGGGNNKVM